MSLERTDFHPCTNLFITLKREGSLCGIVVNMLDCIIIVSEFKLQSCYCIHFWINTLDKGMTPTLFSAHTHTPAAMS